MIVGGSFQRVQAQLSRLDTVRRVRMSDDISMTKLYVMKTRLAFEHTCSFSRNIKSDDDALEQMQQADPRIQSWMFNLQVNPNLLIRNVPS